MFKLPLLYKLLYCFPTLQNTLLLFLSASWWRLYGSETPSLQRLAVRILSLTSSSSACERNWSTFELVLDCYPLAHLSSENSAFIQLKNYRIFNIMFSCLISRYTLKEEIDLLQPASTSWSSFNSILR